MASRIALGIVVVAFVGAAWGLVGARAMEEGDCQASCHAEHTACVETCQSHEDPVECDSRCNDALEDCLQSCR
jgi:hypothetical protein